jgi:hypothetical protein
MSNFQVQFHIQDIFEACNDSTELELVWQLNHLYWHWSFYLFLLFPFNYILAAGKSVNWMVKS